MILPSQHGVNRHDRNLPCVPVTPTKGYWRTMTTGLTWTTSQCRTESRMQCRKQRTPVAPDELASGIGLATGIYSRMSARIDFNSALEAKADANLDHLLCLGVQFDLWTRRQEIGALRKFLLDRLF